MLANLHFGKPFILDTDASEQAIGTVLSPIVDGKEIGLLHMGACHSAFLNRNTVRHECVTCC